VAGIKLKEMKCLICKAEEYYELPDIYDNAKGIKGHKVWCPNANLPMIGEIEKEAERQLDTDWADDMDEITRLLLEVQNNKCQKPE